MSNPEISRRCPACGAAARARAEFCPQCGRSLRENVSRAAPVAASPSSPAAPEPFASPQDQPGDVAVPQLNKANESTTISDTSERKTDVPAAREQGEAILASHRASPRRRVSVVKESGARLRESSADLLNDAADDASLRFVLVAIVLFILFLFFLLLNNLVG